MSDLVVPQITPNFFVDSVETMRAFYIDRLGFAHMMGIVGKDGNFDFSIVTRDGLMIMLARPQDRIDGSAPSAGAARPVEIYFYVKNVNELHDEFRGRGVPITEPITDQWWGDRTFAVQDPYGYKLWFSQTVAEVVPPAGVKMI
jgi:PhnB protein